MKWGINSQRSHSAKEQQIPAFPIENINPFFPGKSLNPGIPGIQGAPIPHGCDGAVNVWFSNSSSIIRHKLIYKLI